MKYTCPNGHESAYRLCLTCREAEILSRVELTKRKKIEVETRGRKKGMPATIPLKDETGKRYGRLLVIHRSSGIGEYKKVRWLCKCDCGREKDITGTFLRRGETRSCGCLSGDTRRKPSQISLTEAEKARCKRVAEKMLAKVKL